MRARGTLFLALVLGWACGDDDGGRDAGADAGSDAAIDASDAMTDAALPPPPTFEAVADPNVLEGCQMAAPADGTSRAKYVECAEELVAGSVAAGRLGDIVMENSRVRVILRASSLEAPVTIGAYGGGVVDAARQGGVDLLKEVHLGLDLASARPTEIVITESGDDGPARVRVLFELEAIQLITGALGGAFRTPAAFGAIDYELRPDEEVLRATVQLTPKEGVVRVAGRPALLAFTGGAAEIVQPGDEGVLGEGDASGGSHGAWLVGEAGEDAYAIRLLHAGGSVSLINSILIVQSDERVVIPAGEAASWQVLLAVSDAADTAFGAVTVPEDGLEEVVLTGAPEDRLEVRQGEALWLRSRVGDDGEVRALLPPGGHEARAGFGPFFPGEAVSGSAAAAAPRATLRVDATADGEVAPLRVTVERDGRELGRWAVMGPEAITLPPGDVRVTLSRGPEYDIHVEDATLVEGAEHLVTADLPRVVDTTGWVAGDFHLHSELSTDSRHALPDAVRIIAAEGLEVVAATDHDVLTDYGPFLEAQGLSSWVLSVVGVEVSDPILAHINGYPLVRDPDASGWGAPRWFQQTPLDTFDSLRAMGDVGLGGSLVQVNHPRRSSSGWFRSIALDPVSGMAGSSPADIGLPEGTDLNDFDFDVVEAFNSGLDEDDEASLADLLGLWENGWRFGMMGNSDSHRARSPAGSPRTYIRVPDDTRGAYDWADVAAGLRASQTTVCGGIFVTVEPGSVTGDSVPVRVVVRAAPWVEVDRLRVYAGSNVVVDQAIAPSTAEIRLDEVFDVPLAGVDFVLARAEGARATSPALGGRPFGVTSPVEVR